LSAGTVDPTRIKVQSHANAVSVSAQAAANKNSTKKTRKFDIFRGTDLFQEGQPHNNLASQWRQATQYRNATTYISVKLIQRFRRQASQAIQDFVRHSSGETQPFPREFMYSYWRFPPCVCIVWDTANK
jgi:hypothetical protein